MSTEYKQPLACPNTVADLCAIKTNFQNPLDNFEARFAAKAKRVFYLQQPNTTYGWISPRVCTSTPRRKIPVFYICRFIKYYVTPVLKWLLVLFSMWIGCTTRVCTYLPLGPFCSRRPMSITK